MSEDAKKVVVFIGDSQTAVTMASLWNSLYRWPIALVEPLSTETRQLVLYPRSDEGCQDIENNMHLIRKTLFELTRLNGALVNVRRV